MPTGRNDRPLISVIMGIYYHRSDTQLLQRSIQSVLSQTYSNFELLICDDGSTEAAYKYLNEMASQDERIRLIRECPRTDLASKLNWCLNAAKGAYIARMDDDDWSDPQRFEKQLHTMEENSTISFVGSNVRLWKDGCLVGVRELPKNPEVRDFLFVQPFIHPALMFRCEALRTVGGYSEDKSCRKCEDYDLLLRLYERGSHGQNLQENLLDYTIPNTAKGGRTMGDRWNEVITRYRRFQRLGLLPGAWPYVVKPILVGILPGKMLAHLKKAGAGG